MTDASSWTGSAEKVQYGVYLGTWVNWSRGGHILGATLTLESRYGLLLLSFTATFVGYVASRFWRIITLLLHRIYSTPEPRDALHHQRQVVLRNSLSTVSTLWTSLQLAWHWRAVADGSLARTLPAIIFAAAAFCAFTVASGFTSSISTSIGNDVLINGSQCGLMAHATDLDMLSVITPWVSQSMNNAANYAQQCYSLNTTGALDCATYVKNRLQFSSFFNASCPFSDRICRSNGSNLLLDSGLISSDDLGLNMPNSQRMFYREMLHCAPLRTDDFVSHARTEHNNYTRYSYGAPRAGLHNWTYEVESLDAMYKREAELSMHRNTKGFTLIALFSSFANGEVWLDNSDFIPIPQLTVPDADLMVAFLSPVAVFFLNQTNDPWYRVSVNSTRYRVPRGQIDLYTPEEAASPLGCVQRHQFCNSRKQCGRLASFSDAVESAEPLFHFDADRGWTGDESSSRLDATRSRFMLFEATLVSATSITDILSSLGSSSLLSSQHMVTNFMGLLPDNQWKLDVSHWFAIHMASLQAAFVNAAHGPRDEAVLPYVMRMDNDPFQLAMCNNQKILSTDYTSLSLFGLYFTYVTGILVILISYIAEPLLALLYSCRKYEEYKYLEWAANSTLQLQRLAYQGLGSEKWTNYTDDVPKTRPGYFLADLARAYPPGDDDDEIQEVKPKAHATSTTTPSVSELSANLRVSEQSRISPSRPVSAVSELVPQAVSPQAVSPISQHPQG